MKIKISIFVSLLPFTLSVFPSPYIAPFHSIVNVTQSPFLLPQIPSPLFMITTEHGLYMWRISMIENVVEYTEWYETYLANQLSIYWLQSLKCINFFDLPVKPDLIQSSGNPLKTTNTFLNPNEAYIFLRINRNKECEGFYWTGADTGPAKRQLTARLLVRMMFDLNIQVPGSKLIHLSREEKHKESDLFLQIFHANRRTIRIPRLFRVTGEKRQLIMEVPPLISQLNGTDAFVLDRMTVSINIWNPNPNKENKNKTKVVRALANRLKEVDKFIIKDQVQIIDGSDIPNFSTFQRMFLNALYGPYGQPPVYEFPTDLSSVTLVKWKTVRNEHLKLFEYSFDGYSVTQQEIRDRPLKMEHLKPDKAHVMTDSYTGTIFIHIGRNAHYVVIEQAMAAGELINWKSSMYPWQKVTLIYQVDQHIDNFPTHFIVNFPNRMQFLQDYMRHD